MKKFIKIAFAVVAFAAVGLAFYNAYGSYTAANDMSEDDLLIAENILALSEDANSYRYPHLKGKPNKCRLEVVVSANTKAQYKDTTDLKAAEGNVSFSFKQIKGMEDPCPITNAAGCNPYTCQQIPY